MDIEITDGLFHASIVAARFEHDLDDREIMAVVEDNNCMDHHSANDANHDETGVAQTII